MPTPETPMPPHFAGPRCEPLEPRQLLSSVPLVPVGSQPEGGLSDKIVYLHGGHGYTADNLNSGNWSSQRPNLLGMVEDLGNQDQMSFLADYLWQAGATVVPLRPVGHQPFEVVLDNDDAEVTFSGSWSNSSSSIYFGDAGDVPYRFASTSLTETAYARYRPDLPSEGYYPVYAWTRAGSDRTEQLYRVHHAGGTTEVTVNHRRVGNGLVYLGTYYFDRGTEGYVDISNRSDETGRVVIADMIRFGNGVGDIDRGGGVSGELREDEAGLYWVKWHVDRSQGIPDSEYRTSSDDRSATVSLSPRYAEYMNREADGSLSDRVFVSFHSNAGSGSNRGVLGLYNGNNNPSTATPNQLLLAQTLAQEVNDDLVAQAGQFEHDWLNRTTVVLDRSDIEFGEINNLRINNEFDATIIETGFHDNQQDAEMLRDPRVRDAIARATYQGIVNYFNDLDGATSTVKLPAPVTNLRALPIGADGTVGVVWDAPEVSGHAGDAATGYRVYVSTDGTSFDGGTDVAGGSTFAFIDGLDPTQGVYYFKVAAYNTGGESLAPDVVAATPYIGEQSVLIVNGFDRLGRAQNFVQDYITSGTTERPRPRFSNSFDYAVQHAEAIEAWAPAGLSISTVQNESVIAGTTDLSDYDAVVWILGEESSADDTFDSTEQALVASYLGGGGKLFVSGAEIGWDLDNLNNGRAFYNDTLRANYIADDANSYAADGEAGTIFEGISLDFDDQTYIYDVNFADVLAVSNGSTLAMRYDTGGGAAVQHGNALVMLGFPFETILNRQDRYDVMAAALEYFGIDGGLTHVEVLVDNDDGPPNYIEASANWSDAAGGYNGGTYRVTSGGVSDFATWSGFIPLAGKYEVLVHTPGTPAPAASEVQYSVQTSGGFVQVDLNQAVDQDTWRSLGVYELDAGDNTLALLTQSASGNVAADAVRWRAVFDDLAAGDLDLDGDVDFTDAMTLRRNFTGAQADAGMTWHDGDLDFDQDVDADDYAILLGAFQGNTNRPDPLVPATSVLALRDADALELTQGQRIPPSQAGVLNGTSAPLLVGASAPLSPQPSAQPQARVQTQTRQTQPTTRLQGRAALHAANLTPVGTSAGTTTDTAGRQTQAPQQQAVSWRSPRATQTLWTKRPVQTVLEIPADEDRL